MKLFKFIFVSDAPQALENTGFLCLYLISRGEFFRCEFRCIMRFLTGVAPHCLWKMWFISNFPKPLSCKASRCFSSIYIFHFLHTLQFRWFLTLWMNPDLFPCPRTRNMNFQIPQSLVVTGVLPHNRPRGTSRFGVAPHCLLKKWSIHLSLKVWFPIILLTTSCIAFFTSPSANSVTAASLFPASLEDGPQWNTLSSLVP